MCHLVGGLFVLMSRAGVMPRLRLENKVLTIQSDNNEMTDSVLPKSSALCLKLIIFLLDDLISICDVQFTETEVTVTQLTAASL